MINILDFNIGLIPGQKKGKNYSHSRLLKWCCLTSSDRARKSKIKIEICQVEPGSRFSRGFLVYWCHLSNYTATHEVSQVCHLWWWVLSIHPYTLANCKSHLAPSMQKQRQYFKFDWISRLLVSKCLASSVCGAENTGFKSLQNWAYYQFCHFIHLFGNYLLNTYCVLGTVLGSTYSWKLDR